MEPADRGLTVRCPLCASTFTAVPEAEIVIPTRSRGNRSDAPRPDRHLDGDFPQNASLAESSQSSESESDHDPHRHPVGGLPASVLVGLALLPFAIPMFWLIVPALVGPPPLLSIAVPCAIAISASILSLAVIYTIDWSPSIRVKGVLILLGMAYFTAGSLYFLKSENVRWIKAHFDGWVRFLGPVDPVNPRIEYSVFLPKTPKENNQFQPIPEIVLKCYTLQYEHEVLGQFHFVVGSGEPAGNGNGAIGPKLGTNQWFDRVTDQIISASGGQLDPDHQTENVTSPREQAKDQDPPGRQFGIRLGKDVNRIVRLYVIDNRVYYLSVERADLSWDDEIAERFLKSFKVWGNTVAKKK